jgi:hypothetical protein
VTAQRAGQRRILQLGGLPQWWPPSQALQWQLQPDPAFVFEISVTRIADHLPISLDYNLQHMPRTQYFPSL